MGIMMADTCLYCDVSSEGGHDACVIEWHRRHKAGLCVVCGQNDAQSDDMQHCGSCSRDGPYKGYPGGV